MSDVEEKLIQLSKILNETVPAASGVHRNDKKVFVSRTATSSAMYQGSVSTIVSMFERIREPEIRSSDYRKAKAIKTDLIKTDVTRSYQIKSGFSILSNIMMTKQLDKKYSKESLMNSDENYTLNLTKERSTLNSEGQELKNLEQYLYSSNYSEDNCSPKAILEESKNEENYAVLSVESPKEKNNFDSNLENNNPDDLQSQEPFRSDSLESIKQSLNESLKEMINDIKNSENISQQTNQHNLPENSNNISIAKETEDSKGSLLTSIKEEIGVNDTRKLSNTENEDDIKPNVHYRQDPLKLSLSDISFQSEISTAENISPQSKNTQIRSKSENTAQKISLESLEDINIDTTHSLPEKAPSRKKSRTTKSAVIRKRKMNIDTQKVKQGTTLPPTEIVEKEELSNLERTVMYKANVILELLEKERDYVHYLCVFIFKFKEQLIRQQEELDCSYHDIILGFSNVEDIIPVHYKLFKELSLIINEWTNSFQLETVYKYWRENPSVGDYSELHSPQEPEEVIKAELPAKPRTTLARSKSGGSLITEANPSNNSEEQDEKYRSKEIIIASKRKKAERKETEIPQEDTPIIDKKANRQTMTTLPDDFQRIVGSANTTEKQPAEWGANISPTTKVRQTRSKEHELQSYRKDAKISSDTSNEDNSNRNIKLFRTNSPETSDIRPPSPRFKKSKTTFVTDSENSTERRRIKDERPLKREPRSSPKLIRKHDTKSVDTKPTEMRTVEVPKTTDNSENSEISDESTREERHVRSSNRSNPVVRTMAMSPNRRTTEIEEIQDRQSAGSAISKQQRKLKGGNRTKRMTRSKSTCLSENLIQKESFFENELISENYDYSYNTNVFIESLTPFSAASMWSHNEIQSQKISYNLDKSPISYLERKVSIPRGSNNHLGEEFLNSSIVHTKHNMLHKMLSAFETLTDEHQYILSLLECISITRKRTSNVHEKYRKYYAPNLVDQEHITLHLYLVKMLYSYINERFDRLLKKISKSFLYWIPHLLEPYKKYAMNYPDSLIVWTKRYEDNPAIKKLIDQICTDTGYSLLDIHGFLIKPVQRISAFYVTVLEEINKNLFSQESMSRVISNLKKMAVKVNSATPEVNCTYSAVYLPCKDGGIIEKKGEGKESKWIPHFVRIQKDLKTIVYINEHKKDKKRDIPFDTIVGCDFFTLSKSDTQNAFIIYTKHSNFIFRANNSVQRNLWIASINDIIRENLKQNNLSGIFKTVDS